ncbi:MAG: hypothetical protein FWE33_06210 [Defluviitaleaceae bacterium]|nr:hypothetical protein [Defluviitaleaceae bacterium]
MEWFGHRNMPVGIAILDTGVAQVDDLQGRIVAAVDFVNGRNYPYDNNAHGTQVRSR